ncbi:hypothetical protein G6F56_014282 [Rhizopus delemar]|nr:hypothetical protein G6F56_014282 [Rhizopus delemar]
MVCAQHSTRPWHGARAAWPCSIAGRARSSPPGRNGVAAARAMDRTAPASALAGGAAARRRRHTGGMVARAAALPCAVHPAIRPAGPGLREAQPVRGG